MWPFTAFILAVAVFFAIAIALDRRKRRQIRDYIEPTGAMVRSIKPTIKRRAEYYVVFESRKGDVRRAIAQVRWGRVNIVEDLPYHHCVKRPPSMEPGSSREVDIDLLEWVASLGIYPGHKELNQIMLNLSDGPHEITIPETDERFARLLQAIEVQLGTERDSKGGILDLVINKKPFKATWRIDGAEPHRTLFITVNPS
jgi:hypothetical protein